MDPHSLIVSCALKEKKGKANHDNKEGEGKKKEEEEIFFFQE